MKKQNVSQDFNAYNKLSMDVQNKNEEREIERPKQNEMLKRQLKLVRDKEVRAVPGGYYTGLINDMHKDYQNFQEKGTFLQMEYLNPLIEEIKQTSSVIDRFTEERKIDKFQAPITLNSLSIQCTLPSDYRQLENLSPLSFLIKYTQPSIYRQQIILKLIRKIQHETIMDFVEAKEIVFEYFNHYKTHEEIDLLFHFLDLYSTDTFQSKDVVRICCYAERYFLHKLAEHENVFFKRPLQEMIDFECLKRKFDGLNLTDSLLRFMKTLEAPEKKKQYLFL